MGEWVGGGEGVVFFARSDINFAISSADYFVDSHRFTFHLRTDFALLKSYFEKLSPISKNRTITIPQESGRTQSAHF